MTLGGFQKFSLSDFPGRISAIVFTQGCCFRCPYCHNPELVDPLRYAEPIPWKQVLEFLRTRRGLLQGVVVTGGEPTIHADLPDFLAEIKVMGFALKLDTNGSNPEMLASVIHEGLVDYIAMDVKAPLAAYSRVVRVPVKADDIEHSLAIVKGSHLPHELRTTYLDGLLSDDDITDIADLARGCQRFALQRFRATKLLDGELRAAHTPTIARMKEVRKLLESAGIDAVVR